jgi:hypothetical protein
MLHAHKNDPSVLLHAASIAQLLIPSVHSLTSTQPAPTICQPELQTQIKDPIESTQWLLLGQLCILEMHSSVLEQITPLLV